MGLGRVKTTRVIQQHPGMSAVTAAFPETGRGARRLNGAGKAASPVRRQMAERAPYERR
jgi:hypothetical protein